MAADVIEQTVEPVLPGVMAPAMLTKIVAQNASVCVGYWIDQRLGDGAGVVVVLERYRAEQPWGVTWMGDAQTAVRLAERLREASGLLSGELLKR
jgi:hypothetical protein